MRPILDAFPFNFKITIMKMPYEMSFEEFLKCSRTLEINEFLSNLPKRNSTQEEIDITTEEDASFAKLRKNNLLYLLDDNSKAIYLNKAKLKIWDEFCEIQERVCKLRKKYYLEKQRWLWEKSFDKIANS